MLRKLGFAIGIIWISAGSLHADDALLEQFYGNGVHDYYQGDYAGAQAALTAAIDGGTNDPRAYYFRGLTYLQLGRISEAEADFKTGAEREVGDSSGVYPVNRSLERIQGRSRQFLEQYRAVVHAAAVQRKEAERRARYEQRAAAEQDVLRRVQPTELPAAPQPSSAAPSGVETAPAASGDENPFAKPAESGAPATGNIKEENAPEKTTPADDKNPFDAEPTKAETAKPEPAKPTTAPPANSDDPFSEPPKDAAPPKTNGSSPTSAVHRDGSVQPTAGGVGSLFRAVAKGVQSDQVRAAGPGAAPMPDFLKGLMGNHAATAPTTPDAPTAPDANATPTQAANQGPPPGNIPPARVPQSEPTPPAAGGQMPAAQPAAAPEGAQQPANPTEPPKDNDNPFN